MSIFSKRKNHQSQDNRKASGRLPEGETQVVNSQAYADGKVEGVHNPRSLNDEMPSQEMIAGLISKAASGHVDKETITKLAGVLRHSVRISRKGVSVSGRGIADLLTRVAPMIPVPTVETMSERAGGMTGESLGAHQVKKASRQSSAVGAIVGGIASAQAFVPPTWLMLPVEILVETLVISAIEMKLVAELHEIYGRPITGTPRERGEAILTAWAGRRGLRVEDLDKGLQNSARYGARGQIVNLVRRKLIARAAKNVSSAAPFLVGAGTAAAINYHATRDLGNKLVSDLGHKS